MHRCAVVFVLTFALPLLSQQRPQKTPSTPAPSGSMTNPFDQSRSGLGPGFRGHDIAAIFRSIQRSPSLRDKGEFETTAAYGTRQAKFVEEPLFSHLLPSSLMAFVLPAEEWLDQAEFHYDADEAKVEIKLKTSPVYNIPKPRVTLKWTSTDGGSYIGTNTFGAKVRIHSASDVEYGIAFDAFRYNDLIFSTPGNVIDRITMPPDKAKDVVPHLRLLLLCHLTAPWFNIDHDSHEATLSEPRDTQYTYNTLYATLSSVWVFDERNGRVIDKVDGGGDAPYPEECWDRSGTEGLLDCARRVKTRDAQCANSGPDRTVCLEQVKAAEKKAALAAMPLCSDVRKPGVASYPTCREK